MQKFYRLARVNAKSLGAVLILACTFAVHAAPQKVILLALSQGKAIFQIDGARRVLRAGEASPDGVRLISADSQQAVVEIAGRREVFSLQTVANSVEGSAETSDAGAGSSVTLWADGTGFFHADGSINGQPVRFLVDTGANTIALNADLARRVGIDYRAGEPSIVGTASGYTRGYGVSLTTVKIGEITLHDVHATVLDGMQPGTPLLGMSFLGRLEMRRAGDKMELSRRY